MPIRELPINDEIAKYVLDLEDEEWNVLPKRRKYQKMYVMS